MVYGDKACATIFPKWIRIDDPAVGSPHKCDITFVPCTGVREASIIRQQR